MPELYAPRWFYTVFANKCDEIEVILNMWQRLLKEPEGAYSTAWWKKRPLFTLTLGLIHAHRRHILSCDQSDLLELMASMSFDHGPNLEELFAYAEHFYQ